MSDSYPTSLLHSGAVMMVKTSVMRKEALNIDIGANPSSGGGENDGEDVDEGVNDQAYEVVDIIDAFRLQSTPFDKKSFMVYIKDYMKRLADHLKEHNPSRLDQFKTGAQEFVKTVLGDFDKYEFYTGESMDPEAMVIIMLQEEGQAAPYAYFFKDGLKEEKM
jgi:hypothetical protein